MNEDQEEFERWAYNTEHPPFGWIDKHWFDKHEGVYINEYVHGLWTGYQYNLKYSRLLENCLLNVSKDNTNVQY